jgi:hypothetical protein
VGHQASEYVCCHSERVAMKILLSCLALCLSLACANQSIVAHVEPTWITTETAAPSIPPSVNLQGMAIPGGMNEVDALPAILHLVASRSGNNITPDQARFLSGTGFGAWLGTEHLKLNWTDSREIFWNTAAPNLGLRATFWTAQKETDFITGLKRELAAGRPALVSIPLGTLLVVGYEPGQMRVADVTVPKGAPTSFLIPEKELATADSNYWAMHCSEGLYGFTTFSQGPLLRDLRPLFAVLGNACVGATEGNASCLTGSRAIDFMADNLAMLQTKDVDQKEWRIFQRQVLLLQRSRKWAGEFLATQFTNGDIQEASRLLLMAADDHLRCLEYFQVPSLGEETLYTIGGILKDSAVREKAAGEFLLKASKSPQPLWWRETAR